MGLFYPTSPFTMKSLYIVVHKARRGDEMEYTSGVQQVLDEFFENLKEFGDRLSQEDMDVAVESLQLAFDDIKKMKNDAQRKKKEAERKQREEEERRKKEEEKRRQQEHIEEVTCMDLPLDWNNPFYNDIRTVGVATDSIADALVKSLATLGRVDIEYIAAISGNDYKSVITALKGSIYQNPLTWNECFYQGWETADEYLSGNLMQKWKAAKKANKHYGGYFRDNIKAIEAVLPPTVATEDIYVTLGSPWVPSDIIDDFIEHLFGGCPRYWLADTATREYLKVIHDEVTGTWEIPSKTRYGHSVADTETYGTSRMEALHILEKTLNMRSICVRDEVACNTTASGKKRVINKEETLLALEKQKKLIKEFQEWVWQDEKRKERLEIIFENKYSCVKKRIFDGSFLEFPNMSSNVKLYPYQKDAVARILFTPNTLLAHNVGAGKTYIMIAAGMELKRMGLSKKNMYVVPNNVLGQWVSIFGEMYPQANLLVVDKNNFKPAKREETLTKMRDNDYDAILITYSSFELIPLSKEYYEGAMNAQIEEIERIIDKKNKATATLRTRREKLQQKLGEVIAAIEENYDGIYFDELGITRLFVDEAHNFKNVRIETKMSNVLGLNTAGSKKCMDMMDKVHMVQRKNEGKGVVFATGTPVTNSVTDAFIMQQYLQSGELAGVDLQHFDSWAAMFAEQKQEFEVDVDTTNFRLVTRLSRFHNLPELTALFSCVADFHSAENHELPAFDGYTTATIAKTADFEAFLNDISARADAVRDGIVRRTEDNMLKITTDGRKAALDLRLIDSTRYSFTLHSKVVRCAENVFDIYRKTQMNKSTQIIFSDIGIPKIGFSIYEELKHILVTFGIPAEEIAFVHDAETETKRKKLFARFNVGEVRVLIGSTFKLGIGVNVQKKLFALHHLDVPWRPADMTQREGRILRQGNTNVSVRIFRYITEGSFDAYSWQLLETKQRFISELLSGCVTERSAGEIDDVVLDYAEVKAIAIGDPLIKERVETANELARLSTLAHKQAENKMRIQQELAELPAKIKNVSAEIENCRQDILEYQKMRREYSKEERLALRSGLHKAVQANVLQTHESKWNTYQGFEVILPANMAEEKPYLWLKRSGKYYVELGNTEVGNLRRIDYYLEHLSDHLEKLSQTLAELVQRESSLKEEAAKKDGFADEIATLKEKLEAIDEKLGVNKDE